MSNDAGMILGFVLFILLFVYILWPEKHLTAQRQKTRLDFLEEQKEQVYLNLRDLNFEYQAGKYPQEDYVVQRSILEKEATAVLTEMDQIQGPGNRDQGTVIRG
jgi:ABC-type phosphate transport system auxiliary subunit